VDDGDGHLPPQQGAGEELLTFLDLIGVRLKPPEPARVVLELTPSEGAEGELLVKKGTQVATLQAGGADPVTFETLRDITLLPVRVVRAAQQPPATVADHTESARLGEAHEPLFAGVQEVERFLYLGDDRLNAFNEEAAVDLFFEAMPGSSGPRVPTITEWQYFDGKRWRDMAVNRAESDARRLSFGGHPGIEKQLVNGVETFWIRGKLAEPLKDPAAVQLDSVSLRVEILARAWPGERVRQHRQLHLPARRPGKSFHPSARSQVRLRALPRPQRAVLGPEARHPHRGAAGGALGGSSPEGSPDLVVQWEYWNGRKWRSSAGPLPMAVSASRASSASSTPAARSRANGASASIGPPT